MQLAGQLRRTTLGDLLGTLYRARAHGVLELTETAGPAAGRAHRIHLADGQIVGLDSEAGELSVFARSRGPEFLDTASRMRLLDRLEALFRLSDAVIAFRVARPHPRNSPLPLSVADYLHGRPRARDRDGQSSRAAARRPFSARVPHQAAVEAPTTPRARALDLLRLPSEATTAQIRHAFRSLAREIHPDRFPRASAAERQRLAMQLSSLTEAYHLLMR